MGCAACIRTAKSEPGDATATYQEEPACQMGKDSEDLQAEVAELQARNSHLRQLLSEILAIGGSPDHPGGSDAKADRTPVVQALVAQNPDLHARLAAVVDGEAGENGPSHGDINDMPVSSLSFEQFCTWAAEGGVEKRPDTRPALETLYRRVQESTVQLSRTGAGLTQQYSVVRVYILASIMGDERCLLEHDRFELRTGGQQTFMLPLEIRMTQSETWQAALERGVSKMIGLDAQWQAEHFTIEDGSPYVLHEKQGRQGQHDLLGLPTAVEVHEVHVRVNMPSPRTASDGSNPSDSVLHQIGLPSGRDFVYCEDKHTIHVWCWRSREYERNGRMNEFEAYLTDHGVDVSKLGTGSNKTLFKFYQEVREQKQSSLHEVCCLGTESVRLERVVQLVKIRLIAEVHRRKRLLLETEQYDADGRKRAAGQLIVRKLRHGETDWQMAVQRAIAERVGVPTEVQEECFTIDLDSMTETEEVKASAGFAGIMSRYKIRTVSMHIHDIDHPHLDCIGLPRGNDFVSKEHTRPDAAPDLHVWTWAPLDGEDDHGEADFAGTALEAVHQDLYAIEQMLFQTSSDPQIVSLGLDTPLKQSMQKLKKCEELLSNIDETIAAVDVNDIMGSAGSGGRRQSVTGAAAMSDLKGFIEATFIRKKALTADSHGVSEESAGLGVHLRRTESFLAASPHLQSMRDGWTNWNFDFFALCEDGGSTLLADYGEAFLVPSLMGSLKCDQPMARSFVHEATSQYSDQNPYHGPIHAAQVCHLSRWLSKAMGIMERQSEVEHTAFMIAAFCHDIRHPGRNNAFCVSSVSPLALRYNNTKVLENFHSATCLELLQDQHVLGALAPEKRALVRSHIIENILATDMADHFETISKFRVRREAQDFSIEADADRHFVARMCIKAGDLGHACLPWRSHVEWSVRATKEFYSQGDEEMRLQLPVSPLCNRDQLDGLAKSQKGFLDFVVLPLFQVMAEAQIQVHDQRPDSEEAKLKPGARTKRKVSVTVSSELESCNMLIQSVCIGRLQENGNCWSSDRVTVEAAQARLRLPPA